MQRYDLDRLVQQSRVFLTRWRLQRELRMASSTALLWLFVGPLLLLVVQGIRSLQGPQRPVDLWLLVALALLGPAVVILVRVVRALRHYQPGRQTGLALFDAQLSSQDRLVTADDFLEQQRPLAGQSAGFAAAAVDDAERFIQKATQTELDSLPMHRWQLRPVSAVGALGAAAIAVVLISGLGGIQAGPREINRDTVIAALQGSSLPGSVQEREPAARPEVLRPRDPAPEMDTVQSPSEATAARQQQRSGQEEAAEGQSNSGASSTTQSASNSSSASGQPSGDKNASKPKPEEQRQKEEKSAERKPKKAAPPPQQNLRLAMESTSGQGKSSGSSSSVGQIDMPEQQDKASPGSRPEDQGGESEDEDEEEKANSATRPDIRDRKPPVDRDLTVQVGAPQMRDNLNGRAGPGNLKKTRGVPSMILGIPVVDRVHGKPNPGRSKVTQENARPSAEGYPKIAAQARLARSQAAGQVEQWQLFPWLEDIVRNYFVSVREDAAP